MVSQFGSFGHIALEMKCVSHFAQRVRQGQQLPGLPLSITNNRYFRVVGGNQRDTLFDELRADVVPQVFLRLALLGQYLDAIAG